MKLLNLIIILVGLCLFANAQNNVGINNPNPDPSAALDIKSLDKGLLIPRMSTARRTSINNPAIGLMVYDSTLKSFFFYDGAWEQIGLWKENANGDAYREATAIGINKPLPNATLDIASTKTTSIFATNSYAGASDKFGGKLSVSGHGSGDRFGMHVNIVGNAIHNMDKYGIYSRVEDPGNGSHYGVFSEAVGNNGIAIYGENGNSPSGYGGYFNGRGFFSGNLGVGVSSPKEAIDVQGTMRSSSLKTTKVSKLRADTNGNIVLASIDTQFFSIPASAFTPSSEQADFAKTSDELTGTGGFTVFAPMHVPHGAKILKVEFFYEDNEATHNFKFKLERNTHGNHGAFLILTGTSNGAAVGVQTFSSSPANLIVNNYSYNYSLSVSSTGWVVGAKYLKSALVTYVE